MTDTQLDTTADTTADTTLDTGSPADSSIPDRETLRRLVIALNAADRIWRPALCRLGAEATRWLAAGSLPLPELARELGVPEKQLRRATDLLSDVPEIAAREIAAAAEVDASLVTRFDPGYPAALLDLSLPPPVLYHLGPLPEVLVSGSPADAGLTGPPAVAIVGSRKPDADGREASTLFARSLADSGVPVVSGFARGIDAAAHRGAIASGRAPTVAVLGCGLGVDYPRGQRTLRQQILDRGGVLLTEWRCDTLPRPWRFPVRNRVIAALARITLVVQAAPRSGSLITARHALELGRDVWAVPGSIFNERSMGTNALIRDGAHPALDPRDLLEVLHLAPSGKRDAPPAAFLSQAPPEEDLPAGLAGRLLQALPPGQERPVEDLAGELDAPVDRALAELLELELTGRVRRVPGPAYRREG